MYNLFFYFVVLLFSIYTLLKNISYAKYEIQAQNNKSGAIASIAFTALSIILTHTLILLND